MCITVFKAKHLFMFRLSAFLFLEMESSYLLSIFKFGFTCFILRSSLYVRDIKSLLFQLKILFPFISLLVVFMPPKRLLLFYVVLQGGEIKF